MANLINMDISSKENLSQSSQKKGKVLSNKQLDSSKNPFAISLDNAMKKSSISNSKVSLKVSDKLDKSLEMNSKVKLEAKSKNPNLNKRDDATNIKTSKKPTEKNSIDNSSVILDSRSMNVAKNSLQVDPNSFSADNSKIKNNNEKVIFSSKGRSIEVSIENLRKDSSLLKGSKTQQSLRAQNSFKKEEKSFSLKTDLISQNDLRLTSPTSANFSSVATEGVKKDTLSLSSQFWQEWESKIDAQIVDKAKIILKDGNSGEIQLKLYPERLGTVRVSLDIEGSQVLARFILDNSQVREVFEANSAFLQKSLEESGLSISLNFSSFSEGSSKESEQDLEDFDSDLALASLNDEVETLEVSLSEDAQALIDMII